MAKASIKRIRDKSIPTTIPCPDSKPSYKQARAALTVYIIIRRRMAMDSLEGMRDKSIPKTSACPDSNPSHQRPELDLPPILSTEDGL